MISFKQSIFTTSNNRMISIRAKCISSINLGDRENRVVRFAARGAHAGQREGSQAGRHGGRDGQRCEVCRPVPAEQHGGLDAGRNR